MRMIGLRDMGRIRGDAKAVRRSLGRALRRPKTYSSAVKELLWTGVNVALYPVGVIGEALDEDASSGAFRGRFARELPLCYLEPEAAATPIILLHGYFHNRSGFLVMRRALRRNGFRHVYTMNYNVIGHEVEELASQLSGYVENILNRTGATRVHLVGHSLGGLVARTYVQEFGGDKRVHTCITMGTPHAGTYAAWAGRGKAARQLRPRSNLLERLDSHARESDVRFISYYSNLDPLVVPASSAKCATPALRAQNVLVKDHGHMSLLLSGELIRSVLVALSNLEPSAAALAPVTRIRATRNGRNGSSSSATGA
jgi:pimeloyl-ACP methyl ester carboxylesterase